MQMQPRHVERGHIGGSEKSGQRALEVVEIENGLLLGDFNQWPIAFLLGNRADFDVRKQALNPNGVKNVGRRQQVVQPIQKGRVSHFLVRLVVAERLVKGDAGKGGQRVIVVNLSHFAI